MKRLIAIGLALVVITGCAEHNRRDIIEGYKHTIDNGLSDWRNPHDTNCLIKLLPIVDSCIEFQDYCNLHDTLYAESYMVKDLKISMLNSLKRYDEALSLIEQLPYEYGLSSPFGKNYLLKTTLIRKYNSQNDYEARDSTINTLIEDMEFQFRASYDMDFPSDSTFYARKLLSVDTSDINVLMDYFIICIARGDYKNNMIDRAMQFFSANEVYRESLIDWINNMDEEHFYNNWY